MSSRYVRKDGTVVKYKYPDSRASHGSHTPTPNLTVNLSDRTLSTELTELAHTLGLDKQRGRNTGEGSISALVSALGVAVRSDGAAAVAKRLRFIAR